MFTNKRQKSKYLGSTTWWLLKHPEKAERLLVGIVKDPFAPLLDKSWTPGGQFWPNSAFLKLPSVTLPKIRNNQLSFGSKEGAERNGKQRLQGVMKTYLNIEDTDFFLKFFFFIFYDPSVCGFISLLCFQLSWQQSTENEALEGVKLWPLKSQMRIKSYVVGRIKYGNFGMDSILIKKLLSRQKISMCKTCLDPKIFIRIFNLEKSHTNINIPVAFSNQGRGKYPVHM